MRIVGAIITLNEENILADCIEGLHHLTKEIYILDSYSSDNTLKIAKEYGCTIYQREFKGYATQRKHLLSKIPENVWVAMVDADEIISQKLALEVKEIIHKCNCEAIFVRRQEYFLGKKMYFSYEKSVQIPRFFKSNSVTIEREINERYLFNGNTKLLKNKLDHYSFNKGIESWIDKHNKYSTAEALFFLSGNSVSNTSIRFKVKSLLYKSKFKLLILFVYYFIIKLPFLDGYRGLYYSALKFYYELMISIKIKEKC